MVGEMAIIEVDGCDVEITIPDDVQPGVRKIVRQFSCQRACLSPKWLYQHTGSFRSLRRIACHPDPCLAQLR